MATFYKNVHFDLSFMLHDIFIKHQLWASPYDCWANMDFAKVVCKYIMLGRVQALWEGEIEGVVGGPWSPTELQQ